jgi:uncharacterized membrane protein YdjX (TVP38/TMEM64 family)
VSEPLLADVPAPRALLWRVRLRLLALACALTAVAGTVLALAAPDAHRLADRADTLSVLQVPAMIAVGAALVVALVPASLVLAGCGYVLGTLAGLPVGLTACAIAAAAAAAIVRGVGGGLAPAALGRPVARASAWIDERPLCSVLVSRLVPGSPFNVVSYALGLGRIPVATIAFGSFVGFAPRALVYTALGGSLHDLGSSEARIALAASFLLLLAALVAPRLLRPSQSVDQREPAHDG